MSALVADHNDEVHFPWIYSLGIYTNSAEIL